MGYAPHVPPHEPTEIEVDVEFRTFMKLVLFNAGAFVGYLTLSGLFNSFFFLGVCVCLHLLTNGYLLHKNKI